MLSLYMKVNAHWRKETETLNHYLLCNDAHSGCLWLCSLFTLNSWPDLSSGQICQFCGDVVTPCFLPLFPIGEAAYILVVF